MAQDAPRILAGRYEVGELIGRGGMAEVHIGHDNRLGRTVAIKILRSDLARDPSFQARFRREAQAAAALNHPAIVAVYDTGEEVFTETSGAVAHVPFIVMEYVEGHTVRDILRDGHALPLDEAVEITAGVLSALEYSHHAGIVHRDIKPANVMLTPTGAIKVMDFGIARAVADSAATMTQTQAVIGTAQYLSPEQARGESVDARSDLYSTGCLLFELLTGRPPFIGDSPVSVAYQHVREAPTPPSALAPDVPEVLDRVTLKALAKDRTDRYSRAAEFRADLESAARGLAVSAPSLAAVTAAATGSPESASVESTQLLGVTPNPTTQLIGTTPPPTTAVPLPSAGQAPTPSEQRSRKGLIWLLIAVAVLAVGGIVTLLLLTNTEDTRADTVTVPPLAGTTAESARQLLQDNTLEMKPFTEPSNDIPKDEFIRSDPEPGASVPEGSTVEVYFSSGPSTGTVPKVDGLDQPRARKLLTDAGFVVAPATVTETHPTIAKDSVTRTTPAADETVPQGTEITLYVSNGLVDLPDLRGKPQADAIALLDPLSLSFGVEDVESTEPPGTVIEQSPAAGAVAQKSRVTLKIAVAPAPEMEYVPNDLIGRRQDEATTILRDRGFEVDAQAQSSTEQPAGRVFASTPPPGSQLAKGETVTIYVSTGPGPGASTAPPQGGNNNSGGGGGGGNNGG